MLVEWVQWRRHSGLVTCLLPGYQFLSLAGKARYLSEVNRNIWSSSITCPLFTFHTICKHLCYQGNDWCICITSSVISPTVESETISVPYGREKTVKLQKRFCPTVEKRLQYWIKQDSESHRVGVLTVSLVGTSISSIIMLSRAKELLFRVLDLSELKECRLECVRGSHMCTHTSRHTQTQSEIRTKRDEQT